MSRRVVVLQDVVAGAVLADDVVDAVGRVLLPRGTELGDATLSGLRRRGVESVALEVAEAAEDVDRRAAHRRAVEQELHVRFRRAGEGAATRLLFRATLEYLLEKSP